MSLLLQTHPSGKEVPIRVYVKYWLKYTMISANEPHSRKKTSGVDGKTDRSTIESTPTIYYSLLLEQLEQVSDMIDSLKYLNHPLVL